jgi:hypothetical protein
MPDDKRLIEDSGLGFNPEAFAKGGNATCPSCATVADADVVKQEGCQREMA